MADAQASGACGSNIVWVQVPSPALTGKSVNGFLFYFVQIILEALLAINGLQPLPATLRGTAVTGI